MRVRAKVEPLLEKPVKVASGLSLTSYYTLQQLNSARSPITMTELAAGTAFSRERVSRVTDELVEADLARRQRDPNGDGRNWLAAITDEGRQRFRLAADAYHKALQREIADALPLLKLRELAEGLAEILRQETSDTR